MKQLILLFILTALLTSCAAPQHAVSVPAEAGSHARSHSFYDVDFSWNTRQNADSLVIAGTAKNVRFNQMHDLELRVTLKNGAGKAIASGVWFFIPELLRLDESSQFEITLKVPAGEKPATADFLYRYRAGDDPDEIFTDMHSFSAPIP